ncbi:hypothetical protein RGU72_05895 [Undibacterium sp. 5I1]|uniref:hypothetical protein n=1 Tax=unclassified Undibacterium TaxID=2630295 RepID=UPI002AB4E6CA|nr:MULTISPECIES: hypothetical protein [unclassified Undibacterium]MDY7537786.1 hypothetical protein [Undibacterium sp. 5I1]MEB0229903.1 hypothetical protein [Undibacterium sp. 10I3]MEB0257632.1 hypothetical protein [Undibacterium sp. 5I1]
MSDKKIKIPMMREARQELGCLLVIAEETMPEPEEVARVTVSLMEEIDRKNLSQFAVLA